MSMYKMSIDGVWCIFPTIEELLASVEHDFLQEALPDSKCEIEVIEMSDTEFDLLPEFQGW